MNITPKLLKKITKNRIFSMTYRRVDGTIGKMVCRFGVKKGLKDQANDSVSEDADTNYITVYNLQKSGYRRVIIANIINISFQGVVVDLFTLKAMVSCGLIGSGIRVSQAVALFNAVLEQEESRVA